MQDMQIRSYLETTKLNVPTNPRCNVGFQSCKVNVRKELCRIRFMSFDEAEFVMHMPLI